MDAAPAVHAGSESEDMAKSSSASSAFERLPEEIIQQYVMAQGIFY